MMIWSGFEIYFVLIYVDIQPQLSHPTNSSQAVQKRALPTRGAPKVTFTISQPLPFVGLIFRRRYPKETMGWSEDPKLSKKKCRNEDVQRSLPSCFVCAFPERAQGATWPMHALTKDLVQMRGKKVRHSVSLFQRERRFPTTTTILPLSHTGVGNCPILGIWDITL